MNIIQDTREQNVLWSWSKDSILRQKLDEGDYSTPILEPYLTIERKSANDLYSTLTSGHQRFKREILRCASKSKDMIIAIECSEEVFYSGIWMPSKLKYSRGSVKRLTSLKKMISTMSTKYPHIHFRWLESRQHMREYIVQQFISAEFELLKNKE